MLCFSFCFSHVGTLVRWHVELKNFIYSARESKLISLSRAIQSIFKVKRESDICALVTNVFLLKSFLVKLSSIRGKY